MVRVKNRYLVVEFLYPTLSPNLSALPPGLAFHGPTADALTPGLLSKSIRNAVEGLFGQIGLGQVGNTLSGNPPKPQRRLLIVPFAVY